MKIIKVNGEINEPEGWYWDYAIKIDGGSDEDLYNSLPYNGDFIILLLDG